MKKLLPYAACVLFGGLLAGLISVTHAAMFPPEITLTQNAVNRMMREAEGSVATLASKCDKCDSQTKDNSRKAMVALKSAIGDLEKETKSKIEKLFDICK